MLCPIGYEIRFFSQIVLHNQSKDRRHRIGANHELEILEIISVKIEKKIRDHNFQIHSWSLIVICRWLCRTIDLHCVDLYCVDLSVSM